MEAVFLDMMHPTKEGHQLMADTVREALDQQQWPARSLLGKTTDPFDASTLEEDAWLEDIREVDTRVESPHRRLFSHTGP